MLELFGRDDTRLWLRFRWRRGSPCLGLPFLDLGAIEGRADRDDLAVTEIEARKRLWASSDEIVVAEKL
jgi:hypothetical protein